MHIFIQNVGTNYKTNLFKLALPIVITVGCTLMTAQHIQSRRHRVIARKSNLITESNKSKFAT